MRITPSLESESLQPTTMQRKANSFYMSSSFSRNPWLLSVDLPEDCESSFIITGVTNITRY
jgi:hypothetical protein